MNKPKKLTKFEKNLVALVHFLAYGNKLDFGLTLEETLDFIVKPIPHKGNKTSLDCLKTNPDAFLEELKQYLIDRS
jgi:hypothetical protein